MSGPESDSPLPVFPLYTCGRRGATQSESSQFNHGSAAGMYDRMYRGGTQMTPKGYM